MQQLEPRLPTFLRRLHTDEWGPQPRGLRDERVCSEVYDAVRDVAEDEHLPEELAATTRRATAAGLRVLNAEWGAEFYEVGADAAQQRSGGEPRVRARRSRRRCSNALLGTALRGGARPRSPVQPLPVGHARLVERDGRHRRLELRGVHPKCVRRVRDRGCRAHLGSRRARVVATSSTTRWRPRRSSSKAEGHPAAC